MVTSEEINPFIKNAWPGSIYRLALPVSAPRFDLSAMEKLLANLKPCHVICFCKFVEIIHNPIMWPKGAKLHKKHTKPLLWWWRAAELWESWRLLPGFFFSGLSRAFREKGELFPFGFTKLFQSSTSTLFFFGFELGIIVTLATWAPALRGG